LLCGQYWFRRSITEFPFSHVLAQTAGWNLIKIAHNLYLIRLFYLELEVILLKVVAAGTSTLSKLFMIDVTSNIILIMGTYLKSHQSCHQILKYSG
jgi:hypothetical protein